MVKDLHEELINKIYEEHNRNVEGIENKYSALLKLEKK
jgi:hypothetical protein